MNKLNAYIESSKIEYIIFPSPITLDTLILPDFEYTTALEEISTTLIASLHGTTTKVSSIIVGDALGNASPKEITIGFPPFSHSLYGIMIKLGLFASPWPEI